VKIDGAFVPKLAKKARLRFDRHEQKEMLLYPERGLSLNETAAAIARKIDGTRSISAIASELAADYGAPADAIEPDVVAFVQDLFDKGLLET
jgi:pyrroloquinoline quinone biosynthesis protein D